MSEDTAAASRPLTSLRGTTVADATAASAPGRTAVTRIAAGTADPSPPFIAPVASPTDGIVAPGLRPRHLASAVFVEGSELLERGTRYQLSVFGDHLRITGTATSLPGGRILSRRLSEVQMISTADRLVIAGTSARLAAFRLIFTDVRNDTATGPSPELLPASPVLGIDVPAVGQ